MIDGFDIVRGMPLDYMHGVLLRVVKMLFSCGSIQSTRKNAFTLVTRLLLLMKDL